MVGGKNFFSSTNFVSPKIALFMNFFYHLCQKLCMCQNSEITVYAGAPPESFRLKIQSGEKSKSNTCFLTERLLRKIIMYILEPKVL